MSAESGSENLQVKRHPDAPSYLPGNDLGPWGIYLEQIDRVAPHLGKLGFWIETLKRPKRALIVDVPIQLDDGRVTHFEGYRVQHNTSRGPGKGGVRFLRLLLESYHLSLPWTRKRENGRHRLPL